MTIWFCPKNYQIENFGRSSGEKIEPSHTSQMKTESTLLSKFRDPKFLRLLDFIKIVSILIFTQFAYAGHAILVKAFAYNANIHPVLFSLLRDVICLPLMGILAFTLEGPTIPKFNDIPIFVSLGLTGIFGNQIGFIVGVYMVGASMASIFQPSIPVWTLLFSLIFGLEPFKLKTFWIKGLGVMSVVGGALLMMVLSLKTGGEGKKFLVGNGFLIMNCISMAIYILIQKRFLFKGSPNDTATTLPKEGLGKYVPWWKPRIENQYPPLAVTFYSYLTGSVFLLIAAMLCFGFQDHTMFYNISPLVLIPLLYAALVQSLICYSLISYANSKVSSTIVTAVWPVQVPVTIVMSAIFFGETLSWNAYLGAILVCGGLLVVCVVKYYEEEMDFNANNKEKAHLVDSTIKQEEGILV